MESSTVELFHVLLKDMTIQRSEIAAYIDCFRIHRKEYLLWNHSNVDLNPSCATC